MSSKDFEFFKPRKEKRFPKNRKPAPGIDALHDYSFHSNYSILSSNIEQDACGPPPITGVSEIIQDNFPDFVHVLNEYCRPKSDVDAIFNDFNRPARPVHKLDKDDLENTLALLDHFFKVEPYDIVHWCDTRFYSWNFSSKADYFHMHSKQRKKEAMLNHPPDKVKPSSKGWFVNAHLIHDRTVCHNIKLYGTPFVPTGNERTDNRRMFEWFLKHPTELLVRSHISKRDKLKVRPVYNAPFLLVRLEMMLIWPLLAQCRKSDNCIMYGLETLRGGMEEIDRVAHDYTSYIMIDWSRFDHDAPFSVIDTFYEDYLPSKINVDFGYSKIKNYQSHTSNFMMQEAAAGLKPKPNEYQTYPDIFPKKVSNLIRFVHRWMKEMIYVTPDGFAYRRKYSGVPSGVLSTQLIDSYVNVFIICNLMMTFGMSQERIKQCKLYIMGDDVVLLLNENISFTQCLFQFMVKHAKEYFNMEINQEKSLVSSVRNTIEVLGYTNQYGYPYKNIDKLIAQLCYPEHHVTDVIMCARAVGIAIASAGTSIPAYQLCECVYNHYRRKLQASPTSDQIKIAIYRMFRYIPFECIDELFPEITEFPSLLTIREMFSRHWGFLSYNPFWPTEYFLEPPLSQRAAVTSLSSYRRGVEKS
nr:MAG: RNA-dependent RNA polymerase [Vivastbo virus]